MKTQFEGLQEKRHRFFLGPEKNRARDLVEWLNALSDRPLEPPRPAMPTLARLGLPSSRTTGSGYFAQNDLRLSHFLRIFIVFAFIASPMCSMTTVCLCQAISITETKNLETCSKLQPGMQAPA
ncbi:hypothetical protein CTAM01_15199 [Colletotrichum tamarilloi]|uniref:Uncharacterized protein n=1 Tax=Colletotrichum tamarilloi TaxID=1209934 RepID=A0ABQ9QM57_9PEZI|nr:uncharacterized protein CTAM01_15199 [Colletotrichum tamarilloi]KAK1477419.1 hypothetical protein CTAM01_15199 [Colletotrichum tamarilloi]